MLKMLCLVQCVKRLIINAGIEKVVIRNDKKNYTVVEFKALLIMMKVLKE
jgi:deoxycytidylate deaminase